MVGLPQTMRRTAGFHPRVGKVLLGSGVVAPVWWVALDVVGSLRYPGYSYTDQTISELSAQGAPTRDFMLALSLIPYSVLMAAFGVGVWRATGHTRVGRVTGAVVVGAAVWGGAGGIAFPMATREVIAAGQDNPRSQMHVWYGIGMPLLAALAVGFGSRLLGRRFRYYSYATILAMLGFGLLMGTQTGAMTANQPTPWMGVEERATGYAEMLWFVVLALALLRAEGGVVGMNREKPAATPRLAAGDHGELPS